MVVAVALVRVALCLLCASHTLTHTLTHSLPTPIPTHTPLEKLLHHIPYDTILSQQDETFQAVTGIPMHSTRSYRNHSIRDIVRLFDASMVTRSFINAGNFDNLLKKLSLKVEKLSRSSGARRGQESEVIVPLNLMFVGGSVCYGHHTYTEPGSPPIEEVFLASTHLSWPRRLVSLLEYVLTKYVHDIVPWGHISLKVSPRYCCRQATSTTHAVDILKGQQYIKGRCSRDVLNVINSTEKDSAPWEPDIILWDYSVNDMNNNWFLARPRQYVYESFVRMSLRNRAALILDFEFINHLSPSPYKKIAFQQRQHINSYYGIPMIDYMSALGTTDIDSDTPLYASRLSNRHPAWPTHVIWSQLALGVILSGLMQWKHYHSKAHDSLNAYDTYENLLPHILHSPPAGHDDYLGFCYNCSGYSSFYDFSDIKAKADMDAFLDVEGALPIKVKGSWNFGSEMPLQPMKTGWIYSRKDLSEEVDDDLSSYELSNNWGIETKLHGIKKAVTDVKFVRSGSSNVTRCRKTKDKRALQSTCRIDDENVIVFRCNNVSMGYVKMEYMTSYGEEWGSVILQANVKYKKNSAISNQDGRYVLPTLFPIEVTARWRKEQAAVSISQEVEISIRDMYSANVASKIVSHDFDYIDVVARMCTDTGTKFKILSVSCC